MKFTKKQENEILTLYHAYWNSYLTGDLRTFASCLDESFWLLGTTQDEIFNSKAAAIRWYKRTQNQILGKVEMRNRKISLKAVDAGVIVKETCDIYVIADNRWTYYAPLRITTTIQKKNNRWKIVQQHGSLPDTKTDAGETIGLDKLKAENLALRDAIKRRTVELENKNRELEIETALERVRTMAMSMNKADDMLQICKAISEQLVKLGLKELRNVQTAIIYKEKGTYLNYEFYTRHRKQITTEVSYTNHPMSKAFVKRMLGGPNQFFKKSLKGRAVREWYLFQKKSTNQFADKFLAKASFLNYYWYSLGPVALGISTYQPLSKPEENICIRFRNVFELSYKRFLDIEKAEVQAREAKIEAALENIRARSLAMRYSHELKDVIGITFKKLSELNAVHATVGIQIFDVQSKNANLWVGNAIQDPQNVSLPYHATLMNQAGYLKDGWLAKKAGKDIVNKTYTKEQTDRFFRYVISNNTLEQIPPPARKALKKIKKFTVCLFTNQNSALFVDSWSGTLFTEDQVHILKRTSKVFEQAYTRFLDLQRAEAQAREAEIELGLERVRARTMAMHKSDELKEVISLVLAEIRRLDILAEHAGFYIDYNTHDDMHIWLADPKIEPFFAILPYFDTPTWNSFLEAKAKGTTLHTDRLDFKQKNKFYKSLFKFFTIPEEAQQFYMQCKGLAVSTVLLDTVGLYIENFSGIPYTEEENKILLRFGNVFQQTYTRFLDLQKAETQAREAQIEAVLERVRAQTMAMHNSEDVGKCVVKMFRELTALGVDEGTRFGIGILNHEDENNQLWTVRKDGAEVNMHIGNLDMTLHPLLKNARKAWKEQAPLHLYVLEGEDLINYYQMINTAPDYKLQVAIEKLPDREYHYGFIFKHGFFYAFCPREFSPSLIQITQRFTSVFAQTYQRYLDLQKAEAQAREGQIQLAMERVRARTMAMQKSDELPEAANLLFQQVQSLGMPAWSAGYCIWDDDKKAITLWMSSEGVLQPPFKLPLTEDPSCIHFLEAHQRGETFYVEEVGGEALVSHYKYMRSLPVVGEVLQAINDAGFPLPTFQIFHCAYFSKGFLLFITYESVPEAHNIFKRFGKVFDQTYTRFLDLQKAEAQAREAQIEAALERIRSRSMAMHKSDELLNVISVVSEQLQLLGLKFNTVSFAVNNRENDYEFWFVAMGDTNPTFIRVPYISNPMYDRLKDVLARGVDFYSDTLTPEESRHWHEHLFAHASLPYLTEETKAYILRSGYARSIAIMSSIMLVVSNYAARPYSNDENDIIKRIAAVFQQSYTRFLDLQKAEMQAHESKIEAALERVRAQALAMHHSQDLSKTIQVYFEQLDDLIDSTIVRCGAGLLNKENTIAEMSTASRSPEGDTYSVKGRIDMRGHPLLEKTYEHWLKQQEYSHVLRGNEIKEYYQYVTGQVAIPENRGKDELHFYFPMFTEGSFYAVTNTEVPENELQIFRRFSSVLSLTYRRFNDLQKAEAQAREAVKQSSLDRIRGEIASMRTATDLERITPLIWKELTTLNIPFIRCGVFIMDDTLQQIHTFLSTPDGKAIAAFHLPYDAPGRTREIVSHWMNNQTYIEHWDETAFSELGDLLVQQEAMPSKEGYLKTIPPGGLYLHCLPFMQGMLYVGNTIRLNEDEIQLIQSVAETFATAYARYEDFNKLESAKVQIEKTLVDLKQTQAQLIQSEKMASLGELTAGIAHEIQNPLNFVNNFSEVSTELVAEMYDEIIKGNADEAKEIANDLKQNLDKINHHGKRAADIVKGMLQHSRTSTGQKELTDINALADEYLRLAYHGLRAKDKSFNAKFETHLDPTLPKLNVIPQDIGRVLLNLINNAFYAVSEKSKVGSQKSGSVYEPTVNLSTKNLGHKIEISVNDNGNGIPESVKEKIFQPFFTTKPTGQGTGLGLSLSYDIVKAHGGELTVQTDEGNGSVFIIQLGTN